MRIFIQNFAQYKQSEYEIVVFCCRGERNSAISGVLPHIFAPPFSCLARYRIRDCFLSSPFFENSSGHAIDRLILERLGLLFADFLLTTRCLSFGTAARLPFKVHCQCLPSEDLCNITGEHPFAVLKQTVLANPVGETMQRGKGDLV